MKFPHADVRCSRRDALTIAAVSPLALWLSRMTGQNIEAAQQEMRRRFVPLILLYLKGGASAKETWDPDPASAPVEFRGELGSIPTRILGHHFAEPWPHMASQADQLAIIRSIKTGSHNHNTSLNDIVIGNGSKTLALRWGERSAAGGVPYASISTPAGATDSFLGDAHQINDSLHIKWEKTSQPDASSLPQPERGQYVPPPLNAHPGLAARHALHTELDTMHPLEGPAVEAMTRNRATAMSLLLGGGEFDRAFHPNRGIDQTTLDVDASHTLERDIQRFDCDVQRYGDNPIGRSLFLARRLVERGTGSVTIHHGDPEAIHNGTVSYDWDDHWNVGTNMRRRAALLDPAIGALLQDLRENRFEAVLAIISEFSRAPRITGTAGREHWGNAVTMVLAGGPHIKGGTIVGRTHYDGSIRAGELLAQDGAVVNTIIHACGGAEFLAPTDVRARDALR